MKKRRSVRESACEISKRTNFGRGLTHGDRRRNLLLLYHWFFP
ncbi:hypothetical protein CKA32_004068 [Geitlerinema sp. FC II]|nr:hypothetical protein CKA32_004068 [Geitlerinema sp. FC II]